MPTVLNPVRSASGIAAVTVLTEPFPCPGRCVYCPTDIRAPKSYLVSEPPVQRALQNGYDPLGQVQERLTALSGTGHPTDKIELIIKGGTWSSYPQDYQAWFIRRCFDAANGVDSETLIQAQMLNETAGSRIIGLTIETRPDWVTPEEIARLRAYGVTRVELGVQILEESVLELTQRDHGVAEVRTATRLLRDAGMKIVYHWMPNLPGATPESDAQAFERLFSDSNFRPDQLKIYPCIVLENAALHRWWQEGRYQAYDDETLTRLLIRMKKQVPSYVRIERIVRDIPAPSVKAGTRRNNLRQDLQQRMKKEGTPCVCIRCREVRFSPDGDFQLMRQEYDAAGGQEIFLSFEETGTNRLAALLRLRKNSYGTAIVRELHTYGAQMPVGESSETAVQHRGLGRRLMAEAERIVFEEWRLNRLAVISGVGVRGYYRKLGYELDGTYMVKEPRE